MKRIIVTCLIGITTLTTEVLVEVRKILEL